LHGGKFVPEERSKEGRTSRAKFSYYMRFVGGQNTYIRGLQKDKSRIGYTWIAMEKTMYICGFPIRQITYLISWVGTDMYRLRGDVNRPYKWSTTDSWVEDISRIFLRFGFLICMIIGEQGFPSFW